MNTTTFLALNAVLLNTNASSGAIPEWLAWIIISVCGIATAIVLYMMWKEFK